MSQFYSLQENSDENGIVKTNLQTIKGWSITRTQWKAIDVTCGRSGKSSPEADAKSTSEDKRG